MLALGLLGGMDAAQAQPLTVRTVAVCDDVNEWPPFTVLDRGPKASGPAVSSAPVTGFSVDVLRSILTPRGIGLTIELLPWVRCLREVESGTRFQMALNASASPDRTQRFFLSDEVHATTPGYFYSRQRFPDAPPVRTMQDLARLRVCGVHGYNYAAYGLSDAQVDRGALNLDRVIAKLKVDRCDIGLGELEVVQAAKGGTSAPASGPEIAVARIPGMPKVAYHMIISRQHPQGAALLQVINAGLKTLRDSGRLAQLHRQYTHEPKP
jgi:polar amino acid transport system substrate-binding protein